MSEPGAAKTRRVEESIEIAAPVEAVWKALTEAEEMTRWFPLQAGTNPDGTVWMAWGDQFRFTARVDASEPLRYVRSAPVFPPGQEPPVKMATEVWLESRGGQTVVRIVQSGFLADASWDEEFDGTRRGWHFQLRGLKLYLERHRGTPRRVAWARRFRQEPADAAWRKLLAADALLAEGSLEGLRAGDRFRFRTAAGETFEGQVHAHVAGQEFAGIVENWKHGMLRIQLDELPLRNYRDVNLWLQTWGVPEERMRALESQWTALIERLFPAPAQKA
jgi:uncharacterized protein YndB with AHSA1/START domain